MILFYLFVGHALADYPLQGDFLAKGKNHKNPIPTIGWFWCLFFHSLIHAGFVSYITNNIYLGLAELVIHIITDYLKCDGKISFNTDQSIHLICKLIWYVVLVK